MRPFTCALIALLTAVAAAGCRHPGEGSGQSGMLGHDTERSITKPWIDKVKSKLNDTKSASLGLTVSAATAVNDYSAGVLAQISGQLTSLSGLAAELELVVLEGYEPRGDERVSVPVKTETRDGRTVYGIEAVWHAVEDLRDFVDVRLNKEAGKLSSSNTNVRSQALAAFISDVQQLPPKVDRILEYVSSWDAIDPSDSPAALCAQEGVICDDAANPPRAFKALPGSITLRYTTQFSEIEPQCAALGSGWRLAPWHQAVQSLNVLKAALASGRLEKNKYLLVGSIYSQTQTTNCPPSTTKKSYQAKSFGRFSTYNQGGLDADLWRATNDYPCDYPIRYYTPDYHLCSRDMGDAQFEPPTNLSTINGIKFQSPKWYATYGQATDICRKYWGMRLPSRADLSQMTSNGNRDLFNYGHASAPGIWISEGRVVWYDFDFGSNVMTSSERQAAAGETVRFICVGEPQG